MGATTFFQIYEGEDPKSAFKTAIEDSKYYHGAGGYTGTIAEKNNFIMIDLPKGKDPREYAEELLYDNDSRVKDKWGPAGCIEIEKPDIKPIKQTKVENITKSGRKKWKTVYKIQNYWEEKVEATRDTKTKAIKKARRLAKRNGVEYRVIVDKELVSHDKLEAKVKPKRPDNKMGKYLFFGWASI